MDSCPQGKLKVLFSINASEKPVRGPPLHSSSRCALPRWSPSFSRVLLSFPREGEEFRRMAEKTMDNAAAAVGGAASTAADGGLAALMGGLGAASRPP